MRNLSSLVVLAWFLLLAAFLPAVWSQTTATEILGLVTDSSGADRKSVV